MKMNKAQERALNRIERDVKSTYGMINNEIKEWKVTENEYFACLVAEMGHVGDEGTLGEVFGRDRVQLFIGKRGGIKYPIFKNDEYRERRYTTMLGAVIDQRENR